MQESGNENNVRDWTIPYLLLTTETKQIPPGQKNQIPTDTLCQVCQKIFQQPHRRQGGGTHKIYCSPKCRSYDWVQENYEKGKAAIIKYESKPISIEAKKERSLRNKFRKYGLTNERFETQLKRQNFKCFGCGMKIDRYLARIDHNHISKRFRGLLCNACNWTLGHSYDNRETLYKLSAYLSYDPEKLSIYILGSLRNPIVPLVSKILREMNFTVWDEWFSAGPEADDNFQKYHQELGYSFSEALKSEVAQHIFYFDKAHLDLCDIGVMIYPAGKSCHLELGYMAAQGKQTFILLDKEPERYDIMPQFATALFTAPEELCQYLKEKYKDGRT